MFFQRERENGISQCWPYFLLDCSFSNNRFQGTKSLGKTWEPLLRLLVIVGLWESLICLWAHSSTFWPPDWGSCHLIWMSLQLITLVTAQITVMVLCFMMTQYRLQQDCTDFWRPVNGGKANYCAGVNSFSSELHLRQTHLLCLKQHYIWRQKTQILLILLLT